MTATADPRQNPTLAIYILFPADGVMSLTGIIMACAMRRETAGTMYGTHLRYLIATFWGMISGTFPGIVPVLPVLQDVNTQGADDAAFNLLLAAFITWGLTALWWPIRLIYGLIRLCKAQAV
ncbi:hypothetical protein [uncultured Cardiobacterium sp.]|uniref:hypothetical protein n=1 Tax=uncultured Cardiobacterium sp. TaxID=417619 RepID=UPI002631066F|nr:hypothetical protein [uncultured Cardiobacterium sp.]